MEIPSLCIFALGSLGEECLAKNMFANAWARVCSPCGPAGEGRAGTPSEAGQAAEGFLGNAKELDRALPPQSP